MSLVHSPFELQIREFLHFLGHEVVMTLAKVATNSRIIPTSTEEAIEVILLHTGDLGKLFSYKRIKSQTIFMYLHKHGVPSLGYASKNQLIVAVQQLWTKQKENNCNPDPPQVKRRASDPSSASNNLVEVTSITSHQVKVGHTTLTVKTSRTVHKVNPSSRSFSESGSSSKIPSNADMRLACIDPAKGNNSVGAFKASDEVFPCSATGTQVESSKVRSDKFSKDFCEWYYTMVNRLQPECANQPGDTFRENIFFSNSSVDLFLVGQANDEKHSQGPSNNVQLLTDMCKQHRLLFSPNLDNGIQAHKSNHGMVKILSCGTLFQADSFIGIFEQEFGLMVCPVDRAWKIMYTKINLKQVGSLQQAPSLPRCQIFEIEN